MKLLITGGSGFTGRHMVNHLLSLKRDDLDLYALYNTTLPSPTRGCIYIQGDLSNQDNVQELISSISPDAIIHLAGVNAGTLQNLLTINVIGTENLLDAVLQERPNCRILVIGSSAEYGYAGSDPISEDSQLSPVSGYGISKVAADLLAQSYALKHNLCVAIARPFNLVGPGQPASFVCGRIVEQAIELEAGLREAMDLGNIYSSRDFIDVRDVVTAYWQIFSHDHFERDFCGKAINVGSGSATSIKEVLGIIETQIHKKVAVNTRNDCQPDLIPTQKSDNSLIMATTGWTPAISLEQSLKDMLDQQRVAFQKK